MRKGEVKLTKLPDDRIAKSKVIAVTNNKGGCGKTTTTMALGFYLSRAGNNVLFWDNDPQSNLSQRLGLPDGKFKDQRLNCFFRNVGMEGFETDQRKLSMVVKYPYLSRIKGNQAPPGTIGIMAGDHTAESEAKSAKDRLSGKYELEVEQRSLFWTFRNTLKFYRDYFDYILMDTAPAMEGNILCQLAARTADEIVIPVDGLEAATGLKNLITWVQSETASENGVVKRPNVLLAMVKYSEDAGEKRVTLDPSIKLRNAVYQALKENLKDYVCDNGVKESRPLRNKGYGGFGTKTDYQELSKEIAFKISMPRDNIFMHWNPVVASKLNESLNEIALTIMEKSPEFKTPRYETLNGDV